MRAVARPRDDRAVADDRRADRHFAARAGRAAPRRRRWPSASMRHVNGAPLAWPRAALLITGAMKAPQAPSPSTRPGRAHRQGARPRRPLLAPRRRALDRRGPRRGQRHARSPRRRSTSVRATGSPSTASRCPSASGRGSGSITSRKGWSRRPATRRAGRRCSTRCRRSCRAWSPSAASTSTPRASCSSPTMAAWPASWNCRRPAGSAATASAPTARSPGGARLARRMASPSTASSTAPSKRRSTACRARNVWLTLGLREGKNREVKRLLAHLGLDTNRLIRISYGPFQIGDLAPGEVREIRGRVLRDQLGAKLAAAAGADFEAPVRAARRRRRRCRARSRRRGSARASEAARRRERRAHRRR